MTWKRLCLSRPRRLTGNRRADDGANVLERQSRIQTLWTAASLGAVPAFTAGTIADGTRLLKQSYLTDLRGWLAFYEASPYLHA